jgi:coiled-coil and C2 domain-containing protein 1
MADCLPDQLSGDRLQMYAQLEKDLLEQYKLCKENRAHFKATAEIASANKFQQMMEHTKKDIDTLRYACKRGDPVPRFHYEVRAYSRVVCNTDLTDSDLEFTVVQGISLNAPKELDSYCK